MNSPYTYIIGGILLGQVWGHGGKDFAKQTLFPPKPVAPFVSPAQMAAANEDVIALAREYNAAQSQGKHPVIGMERWREALALGSREQEGFMPNSLPY